MFIISGHRSHRKHRSSVAVSTVVRAAIGVDLSKDIIPLLLFTGRCLETAVVCLFCGCCLAMGIHATRLCWFSLENRRLLLCVSIGNYFHWHESQKFGWNKSWRIGWARHVALIRFQECVYNFNRKLRTTYEIGVKRRIIWETVLMKYGVDLWAHHKVQWCTLVNV
jgi:hypothetical protein